MGVSYSILGLDQIFESFGFPWIPYPVGTESSVEKPKTLLGFQGHRLILPNILG